MSLVAFQTALANLVRFPGRPLGETINKIGVHNLSDREIATLRTLATDPLVEKFGTKMQFVRQREALSVMRLSADHIARPILNKLYFEYFEPNRTSSDPLWVGVEFLKMILSDTRCLSLLSDCPVYVTDLLKYDYAKAYVSRQIIAKHDPYLPSQSLLCYSHFQIIDLSTDVPAYDKAKLTSTEHQTIPPARSMKMLFLPIAAGPFYRAFQIDSEIETFLLTQRDAPQHWNGPLPKAYPAMVKAGICRLLN